MIPPSLMKTADRRNGAGFANLRVALAGLSDDQLDTHYREGGWTLRQVVHHLADAHINGFVRFKLALTEDNPPIKTYEETSWAETIDGREAPVELSLKLLEALHERWIILLDSLRESDFCQELQPSTARSDDD